MYKLSLTQAKRFPLHIHTATLFILLTIVLGSGQIWFSYQKTSELIRESSTVIYDKVMQEAYMDLKSHYDLAANSVEIISKGDIAHAKNLEQRLVYFPIISLILEGNRAVSGFEVAYSDGDFFIVRLLNSQYMRDQFNAPSDTYLMVDNIEGTSEKYKPNIRIYYDREMKEINREVMRNVTYDPRVRPWYQLALDSDGYATTSPYIYYFVNKVGVTITIESEVEGVVVAADMTLDDLSLTLAKNTQTLSSELVMFDNKGQVLAYKDPKKLVLMDERGKPAIASLNTLGSSVLTTMSEEVMGAVGEINFDYLDDKWGGIVRKISINDDFTMHFAFLAPDKELLEKAIEIRWQSSLIAVMLIIFALPITWYSAYRVAAPLRHLALQTRLIRQLNFETVIETKSAIKEIDGLARDMSTMKETVGHFLKMIKSLAGEKDLDSLLETITQQTLDISHADAVVMYLLQDDGDTLKPASIKGVDVKAADIKLSKKSINSPNDILKECIQGNMRAIHNLKARKDGESDLFGAFFEQFDTKEIQVLLLPLSNRTGENTGLLCIVDDLKNSRKEDLNNANRVGFIQTLSGFAAVSMESRLMLKKQKELLESFIKLIAGAIDAKSHHTAGHCQRVPELSMLLANAASDSSSVAFKDFTLNDVQREELSIAAWLHDCGKVTTPEYVVDKATKLETIYDRIHEVRMRFEVVKRDAQINYYKKIATGYDSDIAEKELNAELALLDEEFKFIAQCNIGQEYMSEKDIERIKQIADKKWLRTIDDRLGVSWEEEERKGRTQSSKLPVIENLLEDKLEHIIYRVEEDVIPDNNPWGFSMKVPKHLYNKGEVYNLSTQKGTLTDEERFKVNEHIIQTIKMLDNLPFPKHLARVPEIAGGHHEKMDGSGYPKKLLGSEMSTGAKIIAIADIFEALTASDRPYKKAKKLSEAITIMNYMKKDNHIDADLFDLFLSSGAYLEYVQKYLSPDQIDFVDIRQFLVGKNKKTGSKLEVVG